MDSPRMMIVVDGRVKAIYVAGDMAGGVMIRESNDDEHPGVTPRRVSQAFFSTLRLVPPSVANYHEVADEAMLIGRDMRLFDYHGNIKTEAEMDAVIRGVIARLTAQPEVEPEVEPLVVPEPEPIVVAPPEPEPEADPLGETLILPSPELPPVDPPA